MTVPNDLEILACQIEIPTTRTVSERDAHLTATGAKVRSELGRSHADIVVLPELSSLEYSRSAFEHLDEIAEPLNGPSFETWSRISREFATYIVYSFARSSENGYHITLAVTGPDGKLVGYYDKIYLAQFGASMEKEFFSRGEKFLTFDVKGFRIGTIICADIRIPELARTLTVEGCADLILHCGAYFRDETFFSWHNFVVTRALENQVFFLSLNRAGQDYGSSMFCPPWVDETRQPIQFDDHQEQFLRLTARRSEIARVREQYSFLTDRIGTYARSPGIR